MERDDKDKWIGQLRNQLYDYSEDVPQEVWDNLEKELSHKAIPLWKRWQSIAAIALVAVASSVMFYLWERSMPSTYIEKSNAIVAKEADKIDNESKEVNAKFEKLATYVSNKRRDEIKSVVENKDTTLCNVVTSDIQHGEKAVAVTDNQGQEKSAVKEKRGKRVAGKSEIVTKSPKKVQKWAIGLNSGGFGVNSSSNIRGAMMRFNGNVSSGDCMASADPIPNITSNTYYSNMMNLNDVKTRKKHYQPVTFGLSLKFGIDENWSLETGLTYTYLLSKLESGTNDNICKQEQKLNYIGIPLKINRNIVRTKRLGVYGLAGAEIEKCVSGKQETANYINGKLNDSQNESLDISRLQLSVSGAVGAEYHITDKIGVYAEPGIVYYFDDKSGIETIRSEHPLNFSLKLGLRFTFSK